MPTKDGYASTKAERIRSAKCAAGGLAQDLTIPGMSYNMAQVAAAEERIRAACPKAKIRRDDYGWRLAVATPDKSRKFIVFWHDDDGVAFLGDVDAIIAALNSH